MRLKGGPELLALLDQLPEKIGRNVVRGGARAAAVVLRDEARSNVRRRSGALAKSLKVSSRISGQVVSAKVRSKGRHSFLAPFLEYGVDRHVITGGDAAVSAGTLNRTQRELKGEIKRSANNSSLLKIGGRWVSGAVLHPGHPAFPFMRPALDNKAGEAINAMGEYIRSRLTWGQLQAPAITVEGDEE